MKKIVIMAMLVFAMAFSVDMCNTLFRGSNNSFLASITNKVGCFELQAKEVVGGGWVETSTHIHFIKVYSDGTWEIAFSIAKEDIR